jgi:hypothetical protein
MTNKNPHIGSAFDDFLAEEDLLTTVTEMAQAMDVTMNKYYKITVNLPEGELLQYIEVASSSADSKAEFWPVRQAEFFQDKWSFYSTNNKPVSKEYEMPENIISASEFDGIWAIGNPDAGSETLRTLLSSVQGYVLDRSTTDILVELERI